MKKNIILATFFVLFILCVPCISNAAVGDKIEKGDFVYTVIDETNKAVEISNKHVSVRTDGYLTNTNKPNYANEPTTTVELLKPVTINGKEYTVTSIGPATFYYCENLENIVIPNTITTIRARAFDSTCSWDLSISDCITLTIPNSVKVIEQSAFNGCMGIKEVVIPEGITTIEESTFANCGMLHKVTLPSTVKTIKKSAFCNTTLETINIPEGVTTIGDHAFNYTQLKNVTIPKSVTQIGTDSFKSTDVINTYKDSAAEKYAKEHNINVVLLDSEIKENNQKVGYVTIASKENELSGNAISKDSDIYKEMSKKLKDDGYTKVYCAYELMANGKISSEGIELTFDVGKENNDKEVMILHKKSNGTYEKFARTVKDGKVKITVKEFSPFMLAIKEKTTTNPKENDVRPVDDEPTTSVKNYTAIVSIIAIISLVGIAAIKLKNN